MLGIERGDTNQHAVQLAKKTAALRIFPSEHKEMDRSLVDMEGSALVVSQFTLAADTKKGNRPSFSSAAPPEEANSLVDQYVEALTKLVNRVETGQFGAKMQVSLTNDGPVTLLLQV